MNKFKTIVLYNEVETLPTSDRRAILVEAGARDDAQIVQNALKKKGYPCEIFRVDENTFKGLEKIPCDIFFNLCDGIGNKPETENQIPLLLEKAKRPFTGSGSVTLQLTTNKTLTKKILRENGLSTPDFFEISNNNFTLPVNLTFPLIVKPSGQDCSIGLSSDSVVYHKNDLIREIQKTISTFSGKALVEKYIEGREFNVTMAGNVEDLSIFPVSEIIFGQSYNGSKPKIIDFDAKWQEDSVNYLQTNGKCPADIDCFLEEQIKNFSREVFTLVGASGYGRVDLRMDDKQRIYFLEFNANPDLYPGMGAAKAAAAFGLNYEDFMEKILLSAAKKFHLL